MYNFLNNLKKERIYKDLKDYLEMLHWYIIASVYLLILPSMKRNDVENSDL